MSNTAVIQSVSDAAEDVSRAACAMIGGCVVGIAVAADWLGQETEQDRKAVDEYREARRRELLENPMCKTDVKTVRAIWPQLKTESLQISNPEKLVKSAQRLGYCLEPLADVKKPLTEQPYIFLQKPTGERLVISYNQDRRIMLATSGKDSRLRHLVRQHTLDCALDHLQKKGMKIQTATLSNGEVQILAREKTSKRRQHGSAEIRAKVRNDGSAWIDVDRLQTDRCHEIVKDFAEAIGGKVTEMKMKTASFQLPGESAKTNIKV